MTDEIPTAAETRERIQGRNSVGVVQFRRRVIDAIKAAKEIPLTLQAESETVGVVSTVAAELRARGWSIRRAADQRDDDYYILDQAAEVPSDHVRTSWQPWRDR